MMQAAASRELLPPADLSQADALWGVGYDALLLAVRNGHDGPWGVDEQLQGWKAMPLFPPAGRRADRRVVSLPSGGRRAAAAAAGGEG
jgi:hypothetical protein